MNKIYMAKKMWGNTDISKCKIDEIDKIDC